MPDCQRYSLLYLLTPEYLYFYSLSLATEGWRLPRGQVTVLTSARIQSRFIPRRGIDPVGFPMCFKDWLIVGSITVPIATITSVAKGQFVGTNNLASIYVCSELKRAAAQLAFGHEGPFVVHSAATPAALNISGPSPPSPAGASFAASARAFWRRSKLSQTSFQFPRVAALLYSVARVSKKLACSTPLSIGASHGSGCSLTL